MFGERWSREGAAMTLSRLALPLGLAALPLPLPRRASAEEVTVFAAASLKTALDAVAAGWEAETGDAVTTSYGGSPQLVAHVGAGAPAELFVSAAPSWMDMLEREGLIRPGTQVDLLGNALVLVAHGEAAPVAMAPGLDTVTLPLALPGIVAGAAPAWAKAMGEFGATITFVSTIPGQT